MRSIRQKIYGKLVSDQGEPALWLAEDEAGAGQLVPELLYLRYALTIRGPESLLFPAFLLDDYGNEVRKLKLYRWLRAQGDYHPRSEVFGYDLSGNETQHFVRELELYFRYPLFVYASLETPLQAGVQVSRVLHVSSEVSSRQEGIRPKTVSAPLRHAAVTWWQLPPHELSALLNA